MPEEMTLAEFQQRYTSQKFVGSGGFAKVFKAFDEVNGYFVALKIAEFRPEHQHFTLQREVSLANQLPPHPNVARYDACYSFDMGLAGKQDIAVLKYYEHGNLEQFLCQNTLSESERRFLVKGILQGIDFLHRHDHLHRDLKAQNVLLHRENGMWQPKIIDFGLSRKVAATDSSVVNSSVGISYSYASPEQVQNLKIRKSTDL